MLKLSISLAALVAVTPAVAQQTSVVHNCAEDSNCDDDVVAQYPEIVVTASRVEQPAAEVGQAVTVITRDEIERRQTTVVSDLLATTPGVTVSRNGGIGGVTAVRIRGAEGDQTLTVIDGVRVNDPSSTGGGFDFANLLSGSVDRIEILRGPNSVPWGSQAIGGVVNIITAQPTQGMQARGSAEYGYADSVFANAGVSGATGAFSGSLTGGYLHTDGISSAASGTERDGYRQYGATGRVGVEFAPGIGVDLRGYYADSHTQFDGFASTFPYGPADGPQYSTTQEIYGYAGLHANLADGRFNNRIAFTIADIDRDSFDPDFPSIARGRSERYEYQGDFKIVDQIRIVAGAERENSRFNDGFTFADTGITSFYGEAIVKPVRQLTITGGIRNDDHDTFGNHTTFGADAALALRTGTTLKASYGEGFKAPTLYQLYSGSGNTALAPETARNYDLGIEQAFLGGHAWIAATYFNRATRDQITFRSCTAAELADPASACARTPYQSIYDNIQRTRADGVELALALRPVDALTFTANYSYIDSQNRSPGTDFGKDLLRRPKQSVTANVDYRLPFGLTVGGTITHVGDGLDVDGSGAIVRLEGYVLAGIRAELPIGERLAVFGRIDNVSDERYETVSGYGTNGRAAYGGVRVKLD